MDTLSDALWTLVTIILVGWGVASLLATASVIAVIILVIRSERR